MLIDQVNNDKGPSRLPQELIGVMGLLSLVGQLLSILFQVSAKKTIVYFSLKNLLAKRR
jgi:hypothetical protein